MWVVFTLDAHSLPTTSEVTFDGPDLATLSRLWLAFCEREGLGASTVSDGTVMRSGDTEDGEYVGRMSYNGKVWNGDTCIYNPYKADAT